MNSSLLSFWREYINLLQTPEVANRNKKSDELHHIQFFKKKLKYDKQIKKKNYRNLDLKFSLIEFVFA